MRKLFLLVVLVVTTFFLHAQEPLFYKGDKAINLGIGVGSYITNFSVSGEMGVMDGIVDKGSIGIGGIVGLGSTFLNARWSKRTTFAAAARGTFHYPFIEKFDTYAGLALGLRYTNWASQWIDSDVHAIGGFFLGGRYYLTDKLAAFGEIGAGIDYLTVGIAYKF